MLTVFSTCKPFVGHDGVIQRNAILSWTLLHPDVEVVLFGDEPGTAEICSELGLVHEPYAERNPDGMKYVHYLFARANEIAKHRYLCFANSDMILPGAVVEALRVVAGVFDRFLLIGRRWNLHVARLITREELSDAGLNARIRQEGRRGGPNGLDYFVFSNGDFRELPPFLVGRYYWDNWMVWEARERGVTVVDVSPVVSAGHQDHGRDYHPATQMAAEALRRYAWENHYNRRLLCSLFEQRGVHVKPEVLDRYLSWNWPTGVHCASHALGPGGLTERNCLTGRGTIWRQRAEVAALVVLGMALSKTRGLRHALGLRSRRSAGF